MIRFLIILTTSIFLFFIFFSSIAFTQEEKKTPPPTQSGPVLAQALICEEIHNHEPYNKTIVLSRSLVKKGYCYTTFDPVPEKTSIYHHWFHRDRLTSSVKLNLNPPRWSTYSTIEINEKNLGPWQVKIMDADNRILKILRFSITE